MQSQPQTEPESWPSTEEVYVYPAPMDRRTLAKAARALRKATDLTGRTTPKRLLQRCMKQECVLWQIMFREPAGDEPGGFCVTEVWIYPNGRRSLRMMALSSGKLHRLKGLIGPIEEYARRLGCSTVEIHGRRGWGGLYPDYHEAWTVWEKRI